MEKLEKVVKTENVVAKQNKPRFKMSKIVSVASATALAIGCVCMSAFAEGEVAIVLSEINSGDVLANMQPFVNAAIPILAVVGGVKLGRNFLRSAFH